MSMAGSGPVLRPAGWRAVELVDVHPPTRAAGGCGQPRRREQRAPHEQQRPACGQDSSRVVSPCSRRPACGMASSEDGMTSGSRRAMAPASNGSGEQWLRASSGSGRGEQQTHGQRTAGSSSPTSSPAARPNLLRQEVVLVHEQWACWESACASSGLLASTAAIGHRPAAGQLLGE
ncbi:hypothetical protein Dimus_022667 [Dionaea muscipula]